MSYEIARNHLFYTAAIMKCKLVFTTKITHHTDWIFQILAMMPFDGIQLSYWISQMLAMMPFDGIQLSDWITQMLAMVPFDGIQLSD